MSRKIKVRGWDRVNEKMLEELTITELIILGGESGGITEDGLLFFENYVTFMLGSGIEDDTGKEIFDGDIVQIKAKNTTLTYNVVFEDGAFVCYHTKLKENNMPLKWGYLSELVVFFETHKIGNIYQDSHLLN